MTNATRRLVVVIGTAALLLALLGYCLQSQPVTAVGLFTAVAAATTWGYIAFAERPRRPRDMPLYRAEQWARRDGAPMDDLPYLRVEKGQA